MITNNEKLTEQLQLLANKFYVLGVQYFEGIKGKDIPRWEEELQEAVDEYEDIRDEHSS